MFNQISVLIPYQPDQGPRDVNLQWILSFYKKAVPGAEILIGRSDSSPFNRSQAINHAAGRATRDLFVIADGDIFFDPAILKESIDHLKKEAWVIPFLPIVRISEANTKMLLASEPAWPAKAAITEYETIRRSKNNCLGGLNLISRRNFMKVGGFDERFQGWGGEDDAFSCAMNTLCKPFLRLEHNIYHLWHPHVGYQNNPKADNNLKLRESYYQANGDKTKMLKLLSGSPYYKKTISPSVRQQTDPKKWAETIHVVTVANDSYAKPLAVMLNSLMANKTSQRDIRIYIIESDISPENKAYINKTLKNRKCSLHFLQVDPKKYSSLMTKEYITKETYYRLSIPDLLGDSVHKALYLDTDIIVTTDLAPLWDTDINRYFLGAVKDGWVQNKRHKDLSIPESSGYFNAGVLLMNLDKWRKHKTSGQIMEFIKKTPASKIQYCSQDPINAILHDKWLPLDLKWNIQNCYISKPDFKMIPGIIHYTGRNKPWSSNHKLKKEYEKYIPPH